MLVEHDLLGAFDSLRYGSEAYRGFPEGVTINRALLWSCIAAQRGWKRGMPQQCALDDFAGNSKDCVAHRSATAQFCERVPSLEGVCAEANGNDAAGLDNVQSQAAGFGEDGVGLGSRIEPEFIAAFGGNIGQKL